jgi:hypothetical protein
MATSHQLLLLWAIIVAAAAVDPVDTLDSHASASQSADKVKERWDDRHYGQIHQDAVEAMARKYSGTPLEGKVTEPLEHSVKMAENATATKRFKHDEAKHMAQINAVAMAAMQLQQHSELPLEHVAAEDDQRVINANTELEKADRDANALQSTKKFHKALANFSADEPGEYQKMFTSIQQDMKKDQAEQLKVAALRKQMADDQSAAAVDKDKEAEISTKRSQLKYDNSPTAPVEESPSYQALMKLSQKDAQMESEIKGQEDQYNTLKKTGKMTPIKVATPKKLSQLDMAKQFLASVPKAEAEDQKLDSETQAYRGRFSEQARTDFTDAKPVVMVTSAASETLYQKLAASKTGDIQQDVQAVVNATKEEQAMEDAVIVDAVNNAPTKKGVEQLVKEGAAGAIQLQKDMAMQNKKDKEELEDKAEAERKSDDEDEDEDPEHESKARSLEEVEKWQAKTVLQEGEDAVIKSAVQVEQTGSKEDLEVLEANMKRVTHGKPPLSRAEAKATVDVVHAQQDVKKVLSGEAYAAYKKGLNASNARVGADVHARVEGILADGSVNGDNDMSYSGDADDLLPDSVDDPMFSKQVDTYGHGFNPSEYDANEVDDDVELRPVEDETSLENFDAKETEEEADREEEKDQPAATIEADAAEDPAAPSYSEKLQTQKGLDSLSPAPIDVDADEAEDRNVPLPNAMDAAEEEAHEPNPDAE